MLAGTFLTPSLLPLQPKQTVASALTSFEVQCLRQLPLVSEGRQLLGLISREELQNLPPDFAVEDALVEVHYVSVPADLGIFFAIERMMDGHLSVLPVLNEGEYIGSLSREHLFGVLIRFGGFMEKGAVLVLEMKPIDYSLSEIASIVESNEARILNVFLSPQPERELVQVGLKLNVDEVSAIVQTFDRYGFNVVNSFTREPQLANTQERYQALMKYLEI
jgi:acetoin utilization protein AcuB